MKHEKSYPQNRHPHRPPNLKSNHQTIFSVLRVGMAVSAPHVGIEPTHHPTLSLRSARHVIQVSPIQMQSHGCSIYPCFMRHENPSTFTCRWGQSICYETTTKNVECHDRISHAPMTLLVKTNIISLCPRLGKSTTQKNSIDSLEMKYIKMKNIIFSCTPSTLPRQHTPP